MSMARRSADLDKWRRQYDLPMHVFGWRDDYRQAGLTRNALYLMRPDGYVALASPVATAEALARYLTARQNQILETRVVIASEAKQSTLATTASHGLLRFARNDGAR